MSDGGQRRPDPPPAPARPTPVRVGAPRAEPPPEVVNATRRWTHPDGRSFEFEVVGRTRAGAGRVGVDLLLLRIRPVADEGGRAEAGADELECLVPGRSLEALSDDTLLEHFGRARPVRPNPGREPDFFEGTRRDP